MLSLVWIGILSSLAWNLEAINSQQPDPVYCYDCHYDPDTEKDNSYAYPGGFPGYPKCAMDGGVDVNAIDKWPCKSGKCFIRRDPNGLVYRGCADPWNLPWGVDDSINCEYQGQKPSLWWFCDGSQCNGGNFGSSDVCADTSDSAQDDSDNTYEETVHGTGENYPGDNGGYNSGKYDEQPDSYGKKSGYDQNIEEHSYSKPADSYKQPASKVYEEENSKDSGYAKKSYDNGKGNSKKGKEGDSGVDVYGIYTAEVAPLYPKHSMQPIPYNHWQLPYNYYYGKNDNSYNNKNSKKSYDNHYSKSASPPKQQKFKSIDPPKQPHYKSVDPPKQSSYKSVDPPKQPSYKSVDPPKQPSYKSVDPPKQPSYKSVDPPKQPSYKSVDPPKQPSYKSVDPPKKSSYKQPSYKSVDPPKQPSYKSIDPPKQPSYKSVDPPKHPSYKSVDHYKQPSYKSVDPPKQPSYKSVDHYKQPSYKSVDPPKQPSYKSQEPSKKSGYNPPNQKSVKQPSYKSAAVPIGYKSFIPPVVPEYKSAPYGKSAPSTGKKSYTQPKSDDYGKQYSEDYGKVQQDLPKKPISQPIDYVHGLYQKEQAEKAEQYNEYYGNEYAGIYDSKAAYDVEVNNGYQNGETDEVYKPDEPYYQQQPVYTSDSKSGYETADKDFGLNQNEDKHDKNKELYETESANPCDGKCKGNPSGLFYHPDKSDWFIQCGNGMEGGKTCSCCKPYYLQCPYQTTFDGVIRVCNKVSGESYGENEVEPKYTHVEY